MKRLVVVLYIFVCLNVFGSVENVSKEVERFFNNTGVNSVEVVTVNGKEYCVDMFRLLVLTAGIESNFGDYPYTGRVAKTFMQLEEPTVSHYMKTLPQTTNMLKQHYNLKLNDKSAIALSYVVYKAKLKYHKEWLNKYSKILSDSEEDVEYLIYKVFFNSIKGASTYKKWVRAEKPYNDYMKFFRKSLQEKTLGNVIYTVVKTKEKQHNIICENFIINLWRKVCKGGKLFEKRRCNKSTNL